MIESIRWWLRALRILRQPAFVRALGEIKTECELIETVRAHYSAQRLRLARTAILENWAPSRLEVGEDVSIGHGSILSWPWTGEASVSIGAHTWIGPYNNLRTARCGRLVIGAHCLISQFFTLITHNHGIAQGALIQDQPVDQSPRDVIIGDDVWIGAGAVLLPGARIGAGAVIAAGAVVRASVPENEIWAGVPARRVGDRPA